MNHKKPDQKTLLLLLVCSLFFSTQAKAAVLTWGGGGSGANQNVWNKKQNWGNSGPPGANDTAVFGLVNNGNSVTPLVNNSTSISNILFSVNASAYTFGGTQILTVGNGGIVNDSSSLQTINTALTLSGSQTWNANSGNLSLNGNIDNAGFTLTTSGSANTTIGGAIAGAGSLIKNGYGTLTLSGSNSFSGGVTVNSGTVLANNTTGSATGSGNVAVNLGGVFGGSGIITGGLTLNSGGKVSAGNSVGTLTTGSQSWNGGAGMDFEIKDATSGAGIGWDMLSINGTLNINATSGNPFTIHINSLTLGNTPGAAGNFDPNLNYPWIIATTTGGINGFNTNAFNLDMSGFSNPFGGTFNVGLANGGNDLTLTYVPEPSTIALGILGAATLIFFRRNRK